jgi:hypothetical protein
MEKEFEILRKTRTHLLNFISDLTIEELNEIPAGFNNNIIWNLGHLLASQQGVCYMRSGNKLVIDENYFLKYKPETKPEGFIDATEVAAIKELFIAVLGQLETDYHNGVFANYVSWNNRYGIEISNIEEAVRFILFHEGLHLGYVMAQKRLVKNKVVQPLK